MFNKFHCSPKCSCSYFYDIEFGKCETPVYKCACMCVYMYMYMYIGANRMRMPCPSFSRRDCRAAHLSSACFKHRAPRHCAADPPQAMRIAASGRHAYAMFGMLTYCPLATDTAATTTTHPSARLHRPLHPPQPPSPHWRLPEPPIPHPQRRPMPIPPNCQRPVAT